MLLNLLFALVAAWLLWSLLALYQNYIIAKSINLPIVFDPISWLNLPWILFNQVLRTQPTLSRLRDRVIRRNLPFSYIGWQFDQGYGIHARFGPAFVLVSPGAIQVMVGDAAAAHDLLSRRKDFIKPPILYEQLNVFGPNLNTAEGEVWQRHRRIAAPSLNERVSASVWEESLSQARQALSYWTSQGEQGVSTTAKDAATLALNVLTACGFGESTAFTSTPQDTKTTSTMSYRDASMIVLSRFPFLLVLPKQYLGLPFMPKVCKQLGLACCEFERHVGSMLEKQRASSALPNQGRGSLLTNLVRASDGEKENATSHGLTDKEIFGNMFIFTLAGHESTANTIATALLYLARYPEYQDWIREELQSICDDDGLNVNDYESTFPRLRRCLAVMHETLRIHGSIVFIPKATNREPQQLRIKDETYIIPANTFVSVNNHAIQQNPEIWGDDADRWLPRRWIRPIDPSERSRSQSDLDNETFLQPIPGAFIPWADGPRICPGKKFAQVEFVAFMAAIFLKHRVSPVGKWSKSTRAEVDGQLDRMLQDAEITTATLQIRNPEMVKLHWTQYD